MEPRDRSLRVDRRSHRPGLGARFKGTNKRGVFRWSTKPEVVVADHGRQFSFVTHSAVLSTKWTYRFEPNGRRWDGDG